MMTANLCPKLSATRVSPRWLAELRRLFDRVVDRLGAVTVGGSELVRKGLVDRLSHLDYDLHDNLLTALWVVAPSSAERDAVESCWPHGEVRHLVEPPGQEA